MYFLLANYGTNITSYTTNKTVEVIVVEIHFGFGMWMLFMDNVCTLK